MDIQQASEYSLYSLLLSKYENSQNYISESVNHDNDNEYLLAKYNFDTSLPKRYDNLNCLLNVNSYDNLTFDKIKTFIETKVIAMKLQGFLLTFN